VPKFRSGSDPEKSSSSAREEGLSSVSPEISAAKFSAAKFADGGLEVIFQADAVDQSELGFEEIDAFFGFFQDFGQFVTGDEVGLFLAQRDNL
jgi:hypothetical protein